MRQCRRYVQLQVLVLSKSQTVHRLVPSVCKRKFFGGIRIPARRVIPYSVARSEPQTLFLSVVSSGGQDYPESQVGESTKMKAFP
jgi:hypothetical protein